jgi:hypothetical protein
MKRWLAVLAPVTTLGLLTGGRKAMPVKARKATIASPCWETPWAADGARLLRLLKTL